MRTWTRAFFFAVIAVMVISDGEVASGAILRTEIVKDETISGDYRVILYGSRHANDVETLAILDKSGDRYTFEPYAPEFDYKVMKEVPAREALKHARPFISWHRSFNAVQMRRVLDEEGEIIAYELRPLYQPIDFGHTDVMYVDYRLKDSTVIVYIRLKPEVERILEGNGGDAHIFEK